MALRCKLILIGENYAVFFFSLESPFLEGVHSRIVTSLLSPIVIFIVPPEGSSRLKTVKVSQTMIMCRVFHAAVIRRCLLTLKFQSDRLLYELQL